MPVPPRQDSDTQAALRKPKLSERLRLVEDIRSSHPDFTLDEQSMLLWSSDGLFNQGHVQEALELALVNVELHPQSSALLQQSGPGRDVRVVALSQTSSRLNVKLFTK
ncbi:MAG: hypothetical protein ACRYFU_05700, partial [Janthinobacterium lividum]